MNLAIPQRLTYKILKISFLNSGKVFLVDSYKGDELAYS